MLDYRPFLLKRTHSRAIPSILGHELVHWARLVVSALVVLSLVDFTAYLENMTDWWICICGGDGRKHTHI